MNGKLPVRIGNLIDAEIAGGPYRAASPWDFGVKLAREIDMDCSVSVPIRDFSVPDERELRAGLVKVLAFLIGERMAPSAREPDRVYVGCAGGWGRTGLFLSCLAKVMSEYRRSKHRPGFDPVLYVRSEYSSRAVETEEQERFVADLDVADIVAWLDATQRLVRGEVVPGGLEPALAGRLEVPAPASDAEDYGRAVSEPRPVHVRARVGPVRRALLRWLGLDVD